ncbi:hypothetical protein TRFO_05020 [Tritrichomonas foetus]|uniref:Uncharacterized protein n=1 Tax=Tritrichomonas foetus TaxID=1144522 RepID=A0A1J4KAH3_9EUKA|nr:hypothetical protein TRFO_05020 [Tritrichomonas foetus]|eukprot:OHT07912.1 hypothetical protein TRFO_05020 [Tritrichomonas foetus]
MANPRKSLLKNISDDFISGLPTSVGLTALSTVYNNGFDFTDKKLYTELRDNMIKSATCTLTYASSYHCLVFVLQKNFNKKLDFEKSLYIKMGSAAVSQLLVNAVIRKKRGFGAIVLDPLLDGALTSVASIVFEWDNGGRDFIRQKFPQTYATISSNPTVQEAQAFYVRTFLTES